MPKLKPVPAFFIVFILLYAFLMVPRHNFDKAMAKTVCKIGDGLFGDFGKLGVIRFTQMPDDASTVRLNLGKRGSTQISLYEAQVFKPRYVIWMHFALLVSLILATPVPIVRRLISLLWGTLLFTLFTYLKILVTIVARYSNSGTDYQIYFFSESVEIGYNTVVDLLVKMIGPSMFIVVVIWVLVSFRRGDWEKIVLSILPKAETAKS